MITDHVKISDSKYDITIINGNMCSWYNAASSQAVAREFDIPIYAPSMGRKKSGEEKMGLIHLPYLEWIDWLHELSKFRFAVNMMPTVAAGTFSLNAAFLGIPCIGNRQIDTQKLCFPELSVDAYDIESACKLARRLKIDTRFYAECSQQAKKLYKHHYSEKVFLEKWDQIIISMK